MVVSWARIPAKADIFRCLYISVLRSFSQRGALMPADIKGAVSSISTACGTIQELRKKRIGSRTTAQFWNEVEGINRQIKGAADEKQAGALRAHKLLWFNYGTLNDEVANLGAVLRVVEHVVDDDALDKISAAGYDRDKVLKLISEGKKMLAGIRADIALHEDNLARKLEGAGISDDSLNRLERRMAALHVIEDNVVKTMAATAGEISKKHRSMRNSAKFRTWAAASLALAAASSFKP